MDIVVVVVGDGRSGYLSRGMASTGDITSSDIAAAHTKANGS